ncbi:unnamed protein product, partial [Discosporangium mesarthrocarpum]
REAFFAPSKQVAAAESVGMACAETICPYPPGIPILLPGEVITEKAIEFIGSVKAGGGVITGCSDSTLETIRVVNLAQMGGEGLARGGG